MGRQDFDVGAEDSVEVVLYKAELFREEASVTTGQEKEVLHGDNS